jgi:DHA3 family macrolide efflux protein-like MFS transporter
MVPVEHLTRVQGLNQMLNGGLNIISAPLGAILYEVLPLSWILMLDVFSALFAILPLFFLDIPQPDRQVSEELSGEKPSFGAELKAGFQYVWNWKGLLIVLLMASFINFLLNPAFSLLPLLVSDHFGKGALELGYLNSTFGVAVIAGGLLLGVWGGFKRQILTSMTGLTFMGIGVIMLGLLPADAYAWAFLAFAVIGTAMPVTNGSLSGIVQAKVAPDMQGRVFTLLGAAAGGMSPLGLLIAGPVSDLVGIQTWFIVGGISCMLMALAGVAIPAVLNLEDHDDGRRNGVVEAPVPAD